MSTVSWSDIRDKQVEATGRKDVERGTCPLISQVRARRLVDMRKRSKSPTPTTNNSRSAEHRS